MPLISVDQAAAHLRLDLPASGSIDDAGDAQLLADLELKIDQASEIVIGYLKRSESTWDDPDTAPKNLQAATLLLLGALWEDREGSTDVDFIKPDGPIARLLARDRDPALA